MAHEKIVKNSRICIITENKLKKSPFLGHGNSMACGLHWSKESKDRKQKGPQLSLGVRNKQMSKMLPWAHLGQIYRTTKKKKYRGKPMYECSMGLYSILLFGP